MAARANPSAGPIGNAATAGMLLAYFVAALWGGQALGGRIAPTTLIWPAAGIGLALVLLRGPRVWPLIFAAAAIRALFAVEDSTFAVALGSAVLNGASAALEPLLAAWLIGRVAGDAYIERAGPFVLAMLVAAPVAALVSTLPLIMGALAAGLVTTYSTLGWVATWHATTASDVMGLLVLTPVICIWARHHRLRLEPREGLELLALAGVAALVLALPAAGQPHYVLFGAHLAIAFRLPLQWSATAVALSSAAYLWQGSLQLGGLTPVAIYESFLTEVTFIVVLNVATYLASLLHTEAARQSERREALLREREALLRALGKAEQRERGRIAEILHDDLQQLLIAARMAAGSNEPDRTRSIIDEAIEAARNLTVELHPPHLERQGIAPALHWLGGRFKALHGLDVRVEADEAAEPNSPEMGYYLFQATRGLLVNVLKHAETDTAWVRLWQAEGRLVLEVEDHGKGCDPAALGGQPNAEAEGYGLFAIRQRVGLLGGELQVSSERGCRVRLTVPLGADEDAGES